MRTFRNISETVESIVPSIGSGSDSGPDLYKCRNCGRDVETDAESCPNCTSRNLRPIHL